MAQKDCGLDCLLHDHGDGASPIKEILPWLFRENSKLVPQDIDLVEVVRSKFTDPHGNIIEAFSNTTGLLQNEDTLYEFARNHVIERSRQGIRYDEFILAPHYHLFGGFNNEAKTEPIRAMTRVINTVVAGIKAGEMICPEIETNLIVGIGRELPVDKAIEVLKALEKSDRNYVVGANLVCDESAFPPELHSETFQYADAGEINFEFHASEWVRKPGQLPNFIRDLPMLLKNLAVVLGLYAKSKSKTKKRIGHGIALPYSPRLLERAIDHQIGVTGCPGSNLQGHNVPNLEALVIKSVLKCGLLWSMNPDDDFFQPDINEVFSMCDEIYHFTEEEKLKMRVNAWKTRFGNRKSVPQDIRPLV